MAYLSFTDLLVKAGIDPAKVKLIRHALTDKHFKECYDAGMVYEYTCHQKAEFSKGYDYWAIFISGTGTLAKFFAIYKVGSHAPDTPKRIPKGCPKSEADSYDGTSAVFDLKKCDLLADYENRLVIDWGKSTRMWHQKGTTEKEIVSLRADIRKVFPGYEQVILSYDELKEIVDNPTVFDDWTTALSSIYAIYLIVDTKTGKQYIGSAYETAKGLLGRWSNYVTTKHGGNKLMKDLLCDHPERYKYFQFSILQILPKTLSPQEVIDLEALYKRKLMSIEFGMNAN